MESGFKELDAIHHQGGNYIVSINDTEAEVSAYAIATHYKKNVTGDPVREFVGSYNFHLVKTSKGRRFDEFIYHLKYAGRKINLE